MDCIVLLNFKNLVPGQLNKGGTWKYSDIYKFTLSLNLKLDGVLKLNPEVGVAVEAVVAETGVLWPAVLWLVKLNAGELEDVGAPNTKLEDLAGSSVNHQK